MSLQSFLGGVGDIIGATQQPQTVNPLYGATYVTPDDHPGLKQPMWLDQNAQDVTAQMNAIPQEHRQAVVTTPYPDVGFWRGLTQGGKEEKQADISAGIYGGQQAQQRQAEMLGQQASTQNMLAKARTIYGQPDYLKPTIAGIGGLNSGEEAGQSAYQADTANDVFNRQAQRQSAELNPDANQYIAPTIANAAHLGMLEGQGNLARNDANQANLNYQAKQLTPQELERQYVESKIIGLGGPNPYAAELGDGTINRIINPTATPYNALTAQMFSGIGSAGTMMGPNGSIANPTWTGQGNASSPITAPTLQGNYGNLPPPANAPANNSLTFPLVGQPSTPSSTHTNSPITPPIAPSGADWIGGAAQVPALQGPQESGDSELSQNNAYDDVLPPQAPKARLPIGTNTGNAGNGYAHIAQMKLRDAAIQQQKLLKTIAKQYGTGSPHYREAYGDYVDLVNSLPK
jgi:hypothetical protein